MMRFIGVLIVLFLNGAGTARAAALPEDFAEMRGAICDSELTKDGCLKCPAYMGHTMSEALKFDGYVEGSFTAAQREEVLLRSSMSCYSHTDGFSSSDAIELSIQTQTYVPSPDCSDEKYEKFIARFTRADGRFEPTAATKDFLERHSKRPD